LSHPRCPLVLDYRRIGVEHFLIGVFATLGATAQRAIYGWFDGLLHLR